MGDHQYEVVALSFWQCTCKTLRFKRVTSSCAKTIKAKLIELQLFRAQSSSYSTSPRLVIQVSLEFSLLCSRLSATRIMKTLQLTYSLVLTAILANAGKKAVADDVVNVHIVPHTHDDVGWLKTVDQYYSGTERSIDGAGVKYILDSVVDELQKDQRRTFIYVEIAFFIRWWREQSENTKTIVKKLVANKQLEFINAGWSMNDEATTDYNAIIDQVSMSTVRTMYR